MPPKKQKKGTSTKGLMNPTVGSPPLPGGGRKQTAAAKKNKERKGY